MRMASTHCYKPLETLEWWEAKEAEPPTLRGARERERGERECVGSSHNNTDHATHSCSPDLASLVL